MKSVLPLILLIITAFTSEPKRCSLNITIDNIKETRGHILVGLYNLESAKGFPENQALLYKHVIVSATKPKVEVCFTDLAPGEYAFAVVQDYNGNKKADKNLVGYPTEPFCFSNNFKPVFTAPAFADCAFTLSASNKQVVSLIH
ncbi:DUF2141 domain-containing protein [bacterium]|nr:DUF2141 domain-containing protein [bacterium]